MSSKPPTPKVDDIRRLLAHCRVLKTACDLDVLLFLWRHPRVLLTSEQLATLVGYEMNKVGASIDAFIDAGFVQRRQNSTHAARMYLLVVEGRQKHDLASLFIIASTRSGRQNVLNLLAPNRSNASAARPQTKRRLHAVA